MLIVLELTTKVKKFIGLNLSRLGQTHDFIVFLSHQTDYKTAIRDTMTGFENSHVVSKSVITGFAV